MILGCEEKPCFLIQENKTWCFKRGSTYFLHVVCNYGRACCECNVTEGVCMRWGFLASWVYQVCLQAGASSFSSSTPEIITYPWAKSPYKVWFLSPPVVLLEQVLLRVSCKYPLQVMTTGVLTWALSLLCWPFLCLSQLTDGDISKHSHSCHSCFSRAVCRSMCTSTDGKTGEDIPSEVLKSTCGRTHLGLLISLSGAS